VENGCEIDFCVKAGAFSTSGLPPVRQPPFMQISIDGLADSLSYSISADGQTWKISFGQCSDPDINKYEPRECTAFRLLDLISDPSINGFPDLQL
jgi:hypothetical protein